MESINLDIQKWLEAFALKHKDETDEEFEEWLNE